MFDNRRLSVLSINKNQIEKNTAAQGEEGIVPKVLYSSKIHTAFHCLVQFYI